MQLLLTLATPSLLSKLTLSLIVPIRESIKTRALPSVDMHLHSQHRCFLPYCSLITLTIAMVIVWLLLLYLLILFHHELLLLLLLSVTVIRSIVCRLSSTLIALGLVLLASFLTIVLTLWRFVV